MTEALAAEAPIDTTTTETAAPETAAPEAKATETAAKPAPAAVEPKAVDAAADPSKAAPEAGKAEEPAKDDGAPPDNWREMLSKGNEELDKILARYSSPANFAKKILEQEKIIRAGKQARPMPDASDEKAMAEWRKEQGIPDDPSGYKLPETVTKALTEGDKPVFARFTDFAHKKGLNNQAVEAVTEWYAQETETVKAYQAQMDNEAREAAEDALRKDWAHGEYKANMTLATRAIEGIPGVGKEWTEFRGPNGQRLGDIPEFIAWAADMGRNQFGDVTFANGDSERKHVARKAEIEDLMKTDIHEYRRRGWDVEYQKIIERESKRAK